MFSGLHMETKKKIARILKASGLQNWMDGVAVCWDREQSRSARLGQSVDKDAYFQQGAKMQIGLVVYEQVGIGCKAHREALDQKLYLGHTFGHGLCLQHSCLPFLTVCGSCLQKIDSIIFCLFVSHLQTFLTFSALLLGVLLECSNEQWRKPWWSSTIWGKERGCQTLLECDSCTKVAVLSESEGAAWTWWNTDTLSRGADSTDPHPPFPKPGRIWSPKSTLLLKKCILTTRQCHCPQEWNALILIYWLSSAGTCVFTNNCNWWILNSPDTSLQGRLHSMTVSSILPLFSLHVVHAHKWLWKYYAVDNPYQDLKKSQC